MTKGEKIKAAREAQKMTQEELGRICGTTKQSIFKYETGVVTNIPLDRLEKIAEALDISPAFLMGWDNRSSKSISATCPSNILPVPKFVKKPRLGDIACGKPILAVEQAEEFDEVPEDIQCDFTLRCKGESMINARIYDGDVVYIREQKEVENGEIAAVRIGEEATLKKVYYNGQRIILRACNPLFEDMEYEGEALNEIEIMGKAVAFTSVVRA